MCLLTETLREKNLADPYLVLALHEHTADFYSTVLSVVEAAPSVVDRLSDRVKSQLYQHVSDRSDHFTATVTILFLCHVIVFV